MPSNVYLVNIGKSNKRIEVADATFGSLKRRVHELCKQMELEGDEIILQQEDKDFLEYVDVELRDSDDLPSLSKFRVIQKEQSVPKPHDKTVGVDQINPSEENKYEPLREMLINDIKKGVPKRDGFYVLPEFDQKVKETLKRRDAMDYHTRRSIIDSMYQDAVKRSVYPKREMYSVMASTLVTAHPHLKDKAEPGYDSWKVFLINKFKNERKNMKSPEVLNARQRYRKPEKECTVEANADDCKALATVNRAHLFVTQEVGEDSRSIVIHKEWMKKKFGKCKKGKNVNEEHITDRMKKTFSHRITIMKTGNLSSVLEEYPFLSDQKWVLEDFTYLTGLEADKSILDGMKKEAISILRRIKSKSPVSRLLEEISSSNQTELHPVVVMKCIVVYFKEEWEKLFCKCGDKETLTPHIGYEDAQNGPFFVYVDQLQLCEVMDFMNGLAVVFACYWLFNISYEKKLYNTLSLLDHAFFKLKSCTVRSPVINIINTI